MYFNYSQKALCPTFKKFSDIAFRSHKLMQAGARTAHARLSRPHPDRSGRLCAGDASHRDGTEALGRDSSKIHGAAAPCGPIPSHCFHHLI